MENTQNALFNQVWKRGLLCARIGFCILRFLKKQIFFYFEFEFLEIFEKFDDDDDVDDDDDDDVDDDHDHDHDVDDDNYNSLQLDQLKMVRLMVVLENL